MTTVFVIGDTHFGHANILNFKKADGSPMRAKPGGIPFTDVEEMDEYMVERWNSVVRPQDHVYHLGDVAMKKPGLYTAERLNGHKRLVRGNHDIFKLTDYVDVGFTEIYGVRVFDDLILSHIPLHPESVGTKWTNVHGHLHANKPQGYFGKQYYNVSAEMVDYTPISLEEVRARIKHMRETIG
jgi:calcineurin-like phosphoesterase family protein